MSTAQFSPPRPEPKRDRWGRYVIPDPDTGLEKSWTRATTFAKTLSDMYGLGKWQERMVAKGVSLRSDLYALAAATPVEDKTKFDKICADAKEAAKASSGANLGTALHAFTEQLDAGRDVSVPAPWDADIAAYRKTLDDVHALVNPNWIEKIVLIPQYGVAGTLDRILHLRDGRVVIGDLKTGRDLSYSWCEIAIQLALYANATHTYDLGTGHVTPMLPVDQDMAIAIHLPVGQARCELYSVDIRAGWETAYIARIVRDWRARKDIAVPYSGTSVKVEKQEDPTSDLNDRIAAATSQDALAQLWRDNKPTWTAELTAAAKARLAALQTTV